MHRKVPGWFGPGAVGKGPAHSRHLASGLPVFAITGARWSRHSAKAVLLLRALITNGDFDTYWKFHLNKNTNAPTPTATSSNTTSPHDQPIRSSLKNERTRPRPGRHRAWLAHERQTP